ncbi:MAG: right-handed parallel beta-helix repeat-containing protein [Solirubrobacterales bacterium]
MSPRALIRAHRRAETRRSRRRSRLAAAGAAAGVMGLGFAGSASAADFPVSTNLDSGAGSLRAAVIAANGNAGPDTISFTGAVGQIELASPISITAPLAVNGPSTGQVKVDGNFNGIFNLTTAPAGADIELANLSLINADAPSAIYSGAAAVDLTVRNCTFTENGTSGGGGSISASASASTVTVRDSTFTEGYVGFDGGAILAGGALVVSGSTFIDNQATQSGGAISSSGSAVISDSTFTANKALAGDGGAIRSSGPLTIVNSKITGSTANGGEGGGISSSGTAGDTVIRNTTVSGNTTMGLGGGLYFGYGGGLQIEGATFSGNSSGVDGGGLYVYAPSGPFTVTNTTIAGNTAAGKGGGVYSFGYYDKEVTFTATTIANNAATGAGSGIFQFGYDGTPPGYEGPDQVSLRSTIVADNTGGADLGQGPSAVSPFEADFSLIGATGGVPVHETTPGSNKIGTGPIPLPPLADNGGPTMTILPAADSAVVDAGKAYGSVTDQRGLARSVQQPAADAPGSDGTDIGAVELQDSSLDGAQLQAKKKQKVKGRKVVIAVKAGAGEAATATAAGTVKLGKKKLGLAGTSAAVGAGERATLKLKPASKKATKKILKALKKGKKAKASVTVTFRDAAGNEDIETAKVKLLVKGGGK